MFEITIPANVPQQKQLPILEKNRVHKSSRARVFLEKTESCNYLLGVKLE
jgi:hypothetical protein